MAIIFLLTLWQFNDALFTLADLMQLTGMLVYLKSARSNNF